ncbi:MAG: hypothetical protein H0W27_03395 [Actinobacteria bacterium]|nr:hypothetical protein [Actinomycetota bacterium]
MEDQLRRFLERMAGEVDERLGAPRPMLRRANHLRARSLLALGVVGALLAYGGIAGMDFLSGQHEQNVGGSTCSWTRMATPNPGNVRNFLSDVAVLAPDDVWAVGGYKWDPQAPPTPSPGGHMPTGGLRRGLNHPLALHWDGVSWAQVAFPEPTAQQIANPTDTIITAFEAISPDDVWAVGSGGVYGGPGFFVHWDGSRWSFVAEAGESAVKDLAARSSDDIWAIGDPAHRNGTQPIVHRWNGSTWTEVAFPELPGRENYLNGVSPVSDAEAWAVGRSWDQPVMSRWGGSAWNLMEISTDGRADQLSDVAATGEGIAWAVGSSFDDVDGTAPERGLIYRWDGSTWSVQPHPAPPSGQYGFQELAVGGPNDVWAVGTSWGKESSGTSFEYDGLLIEHWDGRQWRIVEGPKVKDMASIGSVDVAPEGDLWIAGSVSTEAAEQTLLLVRDCQQESNEVASPSLEPEQQVPGDLELPPGFVDSTVVSSSRNRLVVEAPPGKIRWSFDGTTCSVTEHPLTVSGGGGFGGGGCQGNAYLSWTTGGVGSDEEAYTVAGGRTLPQEGVRVRVTLGNGSTAWVEPREGLWLAVIQRCGDSAGTAIDTIEAVDADGTVLARVPVLSGPPQARPWPPC